MNTIHTTRVPGDRPLGAKPPKTERSRGQILILFVMAIFVFTGMVALVIDVSWYWVNSLRVQRAADAAALAGVVQLPTNPNGAGGAFSLARLEATKNGYADAVGGVTVTPVQDPPVLGRRLIVTVSAPVDMFFMRIFGINTITSTRTSKAEFVLPVPMGSPEAWYGVFGPVRGFRTSTTTTTPGFTTTGLDTDSGFKTATSAPATVPAGTGWGTQSGSLTSAVSSNNNTHAQENTNLQNQQWGDFDLLTGLSADETATTVLGIQVRLSDVHLSASCGATTNTVRVALSFDGGVSWTNNVAGPLPAGNITPNLGTSTSTGDYTFGSATSLAAWPFTPGHTWTGDDLGNSNFRVRLTANKACGTSGTQLRVDQIEVRADFLYDRWNPPVTTTTYSAITDQVLGRPGTACAGVVNCYLPDGAVLTPRGFWGTMNTQGAESINGDAYQPVYDDNTSPLLNNASYDSANYYNYAVEMPPNSTGGSVYIFDPVFCATYLEKGTADRWFSGTGTPVSSFYELYDTQGTLYDPGDDGVPIASSGGLFRDIDGYDRLMQSNTSTPPAALPAGTTDCQRSTTSIYGDGRDYHNNWYLLASGLTGGPNGSVYRVHTTSTDPANASAQVGVNGENSFSIYASASAAPRIYGIGAMQAFTPLTAGINGYPSPVDSEFYLAQIDAVHAGKTVEIKLWDPGDTGDLSGSLQILVPTPGGWTPTLFDYTAAQGTTKTSGGSVPANCNASTGSDVSSVQTNDGTGAPGFFNGCWLTIQIPIPGNYAADQSGWWKIRYRMAGADTSSDVTTWKVEIRGNPVHLIVP